MSKHTVTLDDWQIAMCETLVEDKLNQVIREYPKSNDPDSPAWLLRCSLKALHEKLNNS